MQAIGPRSLGSVEDGSDVSCHLRSQLYFQDVSGGVLLQVELAALPLHRGHDGATRGFHVCMVPGWMDRALTELRSRPDVAVVCGRRRERHSEASVYNLLCDIEWNTPISNAPERDTRDVTTETRRARGRRW